jgi:hypothetical protein
MFIFAMIGNHTMNGLDYLVRTGLFALNLDL